MPQIPHDYDINFSVGVGDSLHTIRVPAMPNRDLAVIEGANALFEWARAAEDRPVPQAAIDYWDKHRQNPGMTFNDVQTDLEANWGIQFGAKQIDNNAPPPALKNRTDKPKPPSGSNREVTEYEDADLDVLTILKRRHAAQSARLQAINADIAEKEKLRDKVETDMSRLELMLASVVAITPPKEKENGLEPRRKRAYKTRRKVRGEVQQTRHRRARSDEAGPGASPANGGEPAGGIAGTVAD